MEFTMTRLTASVLRKAIKGNAKIDQVVDYDEEGKALVYLNEGWTWDTLDGNRSIEGFNLVGNEWEDPDTLAYLKERISNIEPIKD
jgi:hypothetical protein